MGDRGATGGAWGARDDASWWSGGAGEIQHQQQINEDIARSTAAATQQLYTYKMTGGFSNTSGDNSTPNFDYRLINNSNTRDESPQQTWWYASGSVENQQTSSPTSQNQSTSDSEQSNQQANGIQQSHQVLQQQQQQQAQKDQQSQIQQQQNQLQQQLEQHQNLQQAIQQAQNLQQSLHQNQQQTLQQMLQQQQQQQLQQLQQQQQQQPQQQIKIEQANNQQNIIQVTQAQAQALVAQAALQQQVVQTLHQQQQSLQEHLQAVQQQQIQAALQRQSATLQELQQQAQQQALISQNTPKTRMPRSKPPNKPRGRMTAYAFFVQSCREEHKKKYPDENVVFAAFSKKCAERWSTMSEKEKMRFHEMADQDKKRYDLEMKDYVPPKFTKVRGRKRQQPKDPNAPKRSLSAFFWFCNDERSKVKAKNPEYTMGDIAKELGRRWAAADSDTKTKYESLSETDKARYDREMTAYKKGSLVLGIQPQQIMVEPDDEEVEYNGDDEYK